MKRMFRVIGGIFILWGCSETLSHTYATIDAARSAGAVQRGWVPDILPSGTTDIHETHNLDTNVLRGSFRFSSKNGKSFKEALHPDLQIKSQDVSLEVFGARSQNLKEHETTQSLAKRGYQMFASGDYCYAVHWNQGHGFYWSCK